MSQNRAVALLRTALINACKLVATENLQQLRHLNVDDYDAPRDTSRLLEALKPAKRLRTFRIDLMRLFRNITHESSLDSVANYDPAETSEDRTARILGKNFEH